MRFLIFIATLLPTLASAADDSYSCTISDVGPNGVQQAQTVEIADHDYHEFKVGEAYGDYYVNDGLRLVVHLRKKVNGVEVEAESAVVGLPPEAHTYLISQNRSLARVICKKQQ